jgi:hypothetical protein
VEREVERFMVDLSKRSIRKGGLDPQNFKGNWSEPGAILQARFGKVTRTAEENKHRLVTLYRIAVDEMRANQS